MATAMPLSLLRPASSPPSAQGVQEPLSALERNLRLASDALRRWQIATMEQAGQAGLSPLEIAILLDLADHCHPRSFIELCQATATAEPHLAHYALRRLRRFGRIQTGRRGKEKTIALSESGRNLCTAFGQLRVDTVDAFCPGAIPSDDLPLVADALARMVALYDHALRSGPDTPLPFAHGDSGHLHAAGLDTLAVAARGFSRD